jgi:hypothetical protein
MLPDASKLTPILEARRVAIVGATSDTTKLGSRPQEFMRRHGYGGTIVPINPRRSEINGLKAFLSLRAVGEPVDLAIVLTPPARPWTRWKTGSKTVPAPSPSSPQALPSRTRLGLLSSGACWHGHVKPVSRSSARTASAS